MNPTATVPERPARPGLAAMPLAKSFVTVVVSTLALLLVCLVFAPSSLSGGALSGSLPFAAIIAIVGLGQLLVVQQGGFDLSLPGAVSLAVVVSTHHPHQDNALLYQAVLIALAFALAHPASPVAIVGTQRPDRLHAAANALEVHLDRRDVYRIIEASEGVPLP